MSVLSERLKQLRGSQSQAEMATALGIKYQQWAKYERGEVAPGAEMLKQICLVHECSADWLLGLPARGNSTTVTGNTGPVAIGTGAKATVRGSPAASPDCDHCKYKQAVEMFKAL